MSVTPQQMQGLLSAFQQQPQQQTGGVNVPQSGVGQAAALAQKIMLMRALQQKAQQQNPQNPQAPQAPQGYQDPTTLMGAPAIPGAALPQAMNQLPNANGVPGVAS